MTTVYFIRHAEPNYKNHDDQSRELSPKGLQAAQDLPRFFENITIDAFYSSPFKRAIDTILPLAKSREKEIDTIDKFRERQISKIWIEDFSRFAKTQWQDFTYHLDNSESLKQVQTRNIEALNNLLVKHPHQTLVIGSHGTALSTIVNYYQPSFDYEDFLAIQHVFPWIVRLEFDGLTLLSMKDYKDLERPL